MLSRVKRAVLDRPWLVTMLACLAIVAVLVLISCIAPDLALADPDAPNPDDTGEGGNPVEDAINWIGDAISSVIDAALSPIEAIFNSIATLVRMLIVAMYNLGISMLKTIADTELLVDFEHLFSKNSTTIYDFAKALNDSLVTSVGYTFLGIIMLVKLATLGQRMDGNGTLPAVKDVLLLIVWYAVMLFLINNSFLICGTMYTISYAMMKMVKDATPSGDDILADLATIEDGDLVPFAGMDQLMILLTFIMIFLVVCLLTVIVGHFVVWGRALQIYAYAAFAPIALPFLGLDETRQWAMGYIKNFLALCIAGAIIMFVLMCYPSVIVVAFVDIPMNNPFLVTADNRFEAYLWMARVMAFTLVICYALLKSGAWAREILGN